MPEPSRHLSRQVGAPSVGVAITDHALRVVAVDPSFAELVDLPAAELIGSTMPLLGPNNDQANVAVAITEALERFGQWHGPLSAGETDGRERGYEVWISVLSGEDDEERRYVAVVGDATRGSTGRPALRHPADYDGLTGLPNRAMLLDLLHETVDESDEEGGRLALLVVGLDQFKLVNETLGYEAGDHVLRESAARMTGVVRGSDVIARLGGDEFAVALPHLADTHQALMVARRILDRVGGRYGMKNQETVVTASVGISLHPDDAVDTNSLLRNATAAMHRAKERGGADFHQFTDDLSEEFNERLTLKAGLSRALERKEFSLHYQPKVEIRTGRITGVEALLRWESAELGMVSPARFIPVLEETGLIVDVGAWVLDSACRQHRRWRQDGLPAIRIAVNLSARQLREASFVSVVETALADAGIGADSLELEITESLLMADARQSVLALGALHDLGIQIAMDDFGTGYSSLSYLKRFPIDTIKIDRAFVADITSNADDAEIIRTIITMGRTLNRRIVAEGVETEEQFRLLRRYRCDEVQGYFFSRPLPADQATDFLAEKIKDVA